MWGRVRPHRRRLCRARNDVHHAQAACQPKAQPRNVKFRVRLWGGMIGKGKASAPYEFSR